MRPTRDETMLRVALTIAQRGTCDRKQVGAVIAREGRIISVGYNGAPPGLAHCDENRHGWQGWWDLHDTGKRTHDEMEAILAERGCRNATHAEANALAFAAKYGVSTEGAELFVTVSPCDTCARLLIAAGIHSVSYIEAYRDRTGLQLLANAHVLVLQWKHENEEV
jgi:dCMP deaminase